jgi:glycosyltransferase involved in cell wall biosynthesis
MIFSIITITFNAAQFLERTLLSVLSQSFPGIEYIIIDGGSTDGTVDIIKRFENSLACWITEPDRGIYDAMNKGLARANGDYVWFINAGDFFYSSNTVQQIASLLQKKNAHPDIIYGETAIVDMAGNSLGLRRLKSPKKLSWKSFRMGMLVCHQSFVVKREIAPDFDLNYRYSSDFEWCIRCMKKTRNIFNTKLILSCFMEGGISDTRRKDSLKERYKIMCSYYGFIPTVLRHVWFAFRFYILK